MYVLVKLARLRGNVLFIKRRLLVKCIIDTDALVTVSDKRQHSFNGLY